MNNHTPEQKRIIQLEAAVEKLQKTVSHLSEEHTKTTKQVDKLHQGCLRIEQAIKKVEVIARRGVANAAINSTLITAIQRRFKKP
jgi:cell division protein FtsB